MFGSAAHGYFKELECVWYEQKYILRKEKSIHKMSFWLYKKNVFVNAIFITALTNIFLCVS